MNKKYTNSQLVSELLRFKDTHGRFPLQSELNSDIGYPSGSTFTKRFGTFNDALNIARRRL